MSQQPPSQSTSVQDVPKPNYKETLNLPETRFPMKAGAVTREPEIQAFWNESHVYERAMAARTKTHKFVLHDGPPYLSSDKIHIGTALNKVLKDIVTRYKTQRGYYSPYVPGYDAHGLPIENAVVKQIDGGRSAISPFELRQRCRAFALENLKGQTSHFKRLGVWGNWETPYLTIDGRYEARQIELFGKMFSKGHIYKGLKPVYWCPSCETALADAEVEYADHQSHSIYVKFQYLDLPKSFGAPAEKATLEALEGASFVIWTTTPWTLPANLAMAVHPQFQYVVVRTDNVGKLILSKDLMETTLVALGAENPTVILTVSGSSLEGFQGQHPFCDRTSTILLGDFVTQDTGSGIVHIAPGHGMDDYVLVSRYNRDGKTQLPILAPIADNGTFKAEAGERLSGVHYKKGNGLVLEILTEANALLKHSTYDHSYPHCWRCHQPVIFRATEQWFVKVDNFRKEAMAEIQNVAWVPPRGETRISSMVGDRTDWCISRQRVWGVPIPAFYCDDELILNETIIARVAEVFREHTSDVWWTMTPEELLKGLDVKSQDGRGPAHFRKEMDIMDVWFDSGVSHTAVVEERSEELGHLPVELYLEGSDQHRGWFQSALLTSVMLTGKAPYQSVLTHGFVLDEQGRKMSKSLGNVVDPLTFIQQNGADVLRLWVASVDYTSDVRIGKTVVAQLTEVYKKVRNTIRFMMGNLADFNPITDTQPYEKLTLLDRYMLHRLQEVVSTVTEAFDQYEFHKFYQVIQNFCVVDCSSLYFDIAKDILYCHGTNHPLRRGMQTVIHQILMTLSRMLVPVMPHLADDIWLHMPESLKISFEPGVEPPVSLILAPWPSVDPQVMNPELATTFGEILALRETMNLALEAARSQGHIGSALEASVYVQLDPSAEALKKDAPEADMAAWSIVSHFHWGIPPHALGQGWSTTAQVDGKWSVTVIAADGNKCERCWRYTPHVGSFEDHPSLCARCHDAVQTVG